MAFKAGAAIWSLCLTLLCILLPTVVQATPLQCVAYARMISGVSLQGDAVGWWYKAEGLYYRGAEPQVGAVLTFKASSAMPRGHVAVVSDIVDDRHILLNHANWSGHGLIEHGALAEDVSVAGDWSQVRVWFSRMKSLGARINPVFGFIYVGGNASIKPGKTPVEPPPGTDKPPMEHIPG